jgi:hypothetical protein
MAILLAFAPFFVYVVVGRIFGVTPGLIAATLTSVGLLVYDVLIKKKSAKILEIGTTILFAGLAVYALLAGAAWSIPAVRLRVDGGLLAVVLVSMMVRRPFTLQYAREQVAREAWETPEFVRTNYIITAVWGAAFAVMVAVDLVMLYVPALSGKIAIVVTVLAIWGAVRFTSWYPEREQKKLSA